MLSSLGRRRQSARSISPDYGGRRATAKAQGFARPINVPCCVQTFRSARTEDILPDRSVADLHGTMAIFFLSNAFVIVLHTYCPVCVCVCCRLPKYTDRKTGCCPLGTAGGAKGGWGYNRVHCMEHGRVGRSEMGYAACCCCCCCCLLSSLQLGLEWVFIFKLRENPVLLQAGERAIFSARPFWSSLQLPIGQRVACSIGERLWRR